VILTAVAANVLLKYVLKYGDWVAYMVVYQVFGAVIALALTQTESVIVPQSLFGWGVVLLSCVLWFCCAICMYKAFTLEDLTQLAAIYPLRGLAVFIVAALVLGESVTFVKTIGILVICVGTIIVSTEKGMMMKLKSRGVQLAILAAGIIGLVRTVDKFAISSGIISPAFHGVFTWGVPAVLVVLVFHPSTKSIRKMASRNGWKLFATAVFMELSFFFTLMLYSTVEASIVQNLTMLGILGTMVAGYFWLGEKTNIRNRIIGGCVMIVGAALLTTVL